jgi:DNA repair exonuclease SbcCD nuclease subunit
MSNWLLSTDYHLTDSLVEEYRWEIFKHLLEIALQNKLDEICILGDLVDRKDRHSSVLVNKLVEEFSYLQAHSNANITIISGNHDQPLNGPYYWQFLNKLGIRYLTVPELYKNVWLLPFSAKPVEEWELLDLSLGNAIFMHQTGQGATVEGGRELISHNLPKFPLRKFIASGDVHRPQEAGGVIYLGTPHPVRFSETWKNRVIVVENDDFKHYKEVWLPSMKRAILDISSSKDLNGFSYGEGDQLRIRYALNGQDMVDWPNEEIAIRKWAEAKGIHLASVEATLVGDGVHADTQEQIQSLELMKPEEVVRSFSADEQLGDEILAMGLELLKKCN